MEVHLSEDLEKLVQEKVESGRYRSAGEVVRTALLVLDERDQELDMRASSSTTPARAADAWVEFFRIGDSLSVSDSQESGTMTAAVLSMRR
jgi:antitoxin ParD1/3/4